MSQIKTQTVTIPVGRVEKPTHLFESAKKELVKKGKLPLRVVLISIKNRLAEFLISYIDEN